MALTAMLHEAALAGHLITVTLGRRQPRGNFSVE
jgi:hypothetical protein